MDTPTKPFSEAAAQALTNAADSLAPLTTGSPTSTPSSQKYEAELEHKRAFLVIFRRWENLFKRKDGDPTAEKWLIAEYYKSLGHLTEAGFDVLTDSLKESTTFFPTIKECLDATRFGRFDYGHPFHSKPHLLRSAAPVARLAAPVRQIEQA